MSKQVTVNDEKEDAWKSQINDWFLILIKHGNKKTRDLWRANINDSLDRCFKLPSIEIADLAFPASVDVTAPQSRCTKGLINLSSLTETEIIKAITIVGNALDSYVAKKIDNKEVKSNLVKERDSTPIDPVFKCIALVKEEMASIYNLVIVNSRMQEKNAIEQLQNQEAIAATTISYNDNNSFLQSKLKYDAFKGQLETLSRGVEEIKTLPFDLFAQRYFKKDDLKLQSPAWVAKVIIKLDSEIEKITAEIQSIQGRLTSLSGANRNSAIYSTTRQAQPDTASGKNGGEDLSEMSSGRPDDDPVPLGTPVEEPPLGIPVPAIAIGRSIAHPSPGSLAAVGSSEYCPS